MLNMRKKLADKFGPVAKGYGKIINMAAARKTILNDNGRDALDDYPEAFVLINPHRIPGKNQPPGTGDYSRIVLDAVHAGLGYWKKLGIPLDELRRWHAAYDVGTFEVTCFLAQILNAPAILCTASRRVVECNRLDDHPSSMDDFHDGRSIPGNQNLDPEERNWRIENLVWPYRAKAQEIINNCAAWSQGQSMFLSIHSMSRSLDGGFNSYGHVADKRIRPLFALLFGKENEKLAQDFSRYFQNLPYFRQLVGKHLNDEKDHPAGDLPPFPVFGLNEPYDFFRDEYKIGTILGMAEKSMPALVLEMRRDILSHLTTWNVSLLQAEQAARAIAKTVVKLNPQLVPGLTVEAIATMPLKSPKDMIMEARERQKQPHPGGGLIMPGRMAAAPDRS
jgi:predicted N-formylglutamate amidohydrolase